MTVSDEMLDKVRRLPRLPGVYQLKDAGGKVVYVGKALDLRSRVACYFQQTGDGRHISRIAGQLVHDIEVTVTGTEAEALLLENRLIKQLRPRYNVRLKDDKTFFFVRIDPAEEWPAIAVVRCRHDDGARYFGPYSQAREARRTIELVRRHLRLRECPGGRFRRRQRPCLKGFLGQCLMPCTTACRKDDYRAAVDKALLFFGGRRRLLLDELERAMAEASARLEFERAAVLRDAREAIRATLERQSVVLPGFADVDALGIEADPPSAGICLVRYREGVFESAFPHFVAEHWGDTAELALDFIRAWYGQSDGLPGRLLLDGRPIADPDAFRGECAARLPGVSISFPRRGPYADALAMAARNARERLHAARKREADAGTGLTELASALRLAGPPRRIECFDCSNVQGSSPVAAMVTFENGRLDRAGYRRFTIRGAGPGDDYGMLAEALRRRFARELPPPDLLLIDGGRGHLAVAARAVAAAGPAGPVCLLAIAKDHGRGGDTIWRHGQKGPVSFRRAPAGYLLLQRMRDEAHRSAIGYHRKRRDRAGLETGLATVPGMGKVRVARVLAAIGGGGSILAAGADGLRERAGVPQAVAERVVAYLMGRDDADA